MQFSTRSLAAASAAFVLALPLPAADNGEKSQETVSVFGKATLEVPSSFERTKPKSRIVQDEFVAKAGEGDEAETARVYMMASGGSIRANLDRWKGQFAGDEKAFQSKEMELGGWDVFMAEHEGTYSDRVGGGPFFGGRVVKRSDYAMVGAILVPPDPSDADAPVDARPKYFVKMIGPKSVVEANREAFVEMVKSLDE
jgi:hypothetical protein